MPFGLHAFDIVIVMVVALLIFGPKRLPEMGSAIGQTFQSFKRSMNEITSEVKSEAAAKTPEIAAPLTETPTIVEPLAPVTREPVLH